MLSPKGGTGKTTVSTHVAVGLARRRPDDVVLVDLDVAFGDVAPALLLDARHGLLDVARGAAPARHRSGVHVVAAPDTDEPLDLVADEELEHALDTVLSRYAIAVLDTGAGFDPVTRAAVQRATDIVLVASLDVPSLLALRKVMRWVDGLGQTGAVRHLVVNRATLLAGVELADVGQTLGMQPDVEIPDDPAIALAVTAGVPLTEHDHEGGPPAVAAFERLLDRLTPAPRRPWRR